MHPHGDSSGLVITPRSRVGLLVPRGGRRGAEADRHAVVGVHETDRYREVGESLLVEDSCSRFIISVWHASFRHARHGFRPGERRPFVTIEKAAGLTPGRN